MKKAKFRGISKKTGEFIYGMPNYDYTHIFNSEQVDSPDNYEVVYETIGQLTPSKDRNKKGIYEDDVLSEKWKVIVYRGITGVYMVKFGLNPEVNHQKTLWRYLQDREKAGTGERDCIVIGNIHQNPELLK